MEDSKANMPVVSITEGMKGVSLATMKSQINAIQGAMRSLMTDGEHYGVIPGTKKKSLYKAGAEKIGLMFRLAPQYEVFTSFEDATGHMNCRVTCTLVHIVNGQVWGQGLGMGSTKEAKYRYRTGEGEITDKRVPSEYWNVRKLDPKKAQAMLGGSDFTVKKVDNLWYIAKKSDQKVEYDNPADFYNTVVKMAKKRAHVDAIITATAASDIFTQDIKDDEKEGNGES